MSRALPNATLIGFTGTPIDKGFRRSTMRRFGSIIDSYTIPQSVADGATVPIWYEARLPDLAIEGPATLDRLFDALFGDESEEMQARIRRRYANKETVAEAEPTDRDDRPGHRGALQGDDPAQRLQGAGCGAKPGRRAALRRTPEQLRTQRISHHHEAVPTTGRSSARRAISTRSKSPTRSSTLKASRRFWSSLTCC